MAVFGRNKKPELLEMTSSGYNLNYVPIIGQLNRRTNNYSENLETYKLMEKDAVISGALELWATDATQADSEKGHSVWIECSNPTIKAELEDFLYNTVKVEDKLFAWAYKIARDGQVFLRTYDDNNEWYFETIRSSELVYPLIQKGKIIKYYFEDKDGEGAIYNDKEFIPFIASLDESYDKIKLRTKDNNTELEYDCIHGESFLKGAVVAWRVLSVMEEVLLLTRVGKSSVFNLVKINVGNATKKEADVLIEKTKKVFKTSEALNLMDNMYKSQNNPIAANENIYIPTRDGVGDVTVEAVGGNYELKDALDLDYFRNKLFAALHIPKNYLGFDGGDATTVLGDNSLARMDERYARSCKRLQAVLRSGINSLCNYYLINTGRDIDRVPTFKVCMTGISSVEEKTRREEFGNRLDNASKFVELVTSQFANQVDRNKLFYYTFSNLLGMSADAFSNQTLATVPVKNYNIRGTGFGDASDDRKFINLRLDQITSSEESETMLDGVCLNIDGKVKPLNECVDLYPKELFEVGYKELKQRVQKTDPDRITKAKMLTTSYIGLNRSGDLMFKTSSGTTPGKFWYQTIRLLDLPDLIDLFGKEGDVSDQDIIRTAIEGDIAVYCNDPSFTFYAWKYMADKDHYGIEPENRAPTRNNLNLRGAVCKHLYVVLQVLPFWTNKIVQDLRKQFFRTKDSRTKAPKKVDYEPGKKQDYKLNTGEKDPLRSIPLDKSDL